MNTKILTHKESFASRHTVLIDALIIVALMLLSIGLRLPTLSIPDRSISGPDVFTDEQGYLYLTDPDSYYYARRTRDYASEDSILPHAIPDTVRTNLSGDTSAHFDLFPYFMSLFYRVATSYGIPENAFFVYAGPILFSFSIIPAYVFVRRRVGRFGAIFAGLLVGFSPAFFSDSNFAYYDTDIILFILPLIIFTCLLESLDAKNKKQYIIYASLSMLAFLFLALSWSTADVYLYLIVGFTVLLLIWKWIEKKKFTLALKDSSVRRLCLYVLVGLLAMFAVRGTLISESITGAISSIIGSELSGPSPGKFVSELRASTFITNDDWFNLTTGSVIADAGGIVVCAVALCTLVYFGVRAIIQKKPNEFLLFLPWIFATLFAASIAARFGKLVCIPIALIAPYGLGSFYQFILKHKPDVVGIYVFFSALLIGIPLLGVSLYDEKYSGDSDDSLVLASKFISEHNEGRTDSIIVSWWDPGYIYEYETGILTLMDGGTYNGYYYEQVTRMFLDDSPITAEETIKNFLKEISCDAKRLYIPVDKSYSSSGFVNVFKYYANYGSEKEYDYRGSVLQNMSEKNNIGNFNFLTSISEPGSSSINIYVLELE